MPTRRHVLTVLALLAVLAGAALAAALLAGSHAVSLAELAQALAGKAQSTGAQVIANLRLPRALAAFACGGLLALAGTLLQVLLRNPLADPFVLGVSGGASLGALSALWLGLAGVWLQGAAFAGALAAMLVVFLLAHGRGPWSAARMLLTGVIVASLCSAGVALMLSLAPDAQLRGMLYWLMGDASMAESPRAALTTLLFGVAATLPFARELNLLARGELSARALGVAVPQLTRLIFLLASLCTAVAVTTVGAVGFVGLIVPHLLRLSAGTDLRLLLPAAALAGGTLLTVADTLARTVAAPQQLPVGVLTALLGAPVFLWLLGRQTR